jgi:hypothetical protein
VALSPAVAKWLKGTCGAADVALGGISWGKVLQRGKKASAALKGGRRQACQGAVLGWAGLAQIGLDCQCKSLPLPPNRIYYRHPVCYSDSPTPVYVIASSLLQGIWWMPEASDAQPSHLGGSSAALRAAAAEAAKGAAGAEGGLAGPELLKLAASLRMNTGGWLPRCPLAVTCCSLRVDCQVDCPIISWTWVVDRIPTAALCVLLLLLLLLWLLFVCRAFCVLVVHGVACPAQTPRTRSHLALLLAHHCFVRSCAQHLSPTPRASLTTPPHLLHHTSSPDTSVRTSHTYRCAPSGVLRGHGLRGLR